MLTPASVISGVISTVISTVNVNGLRAAARKGFVEWLAATDADVVCLQEVRAELDQLPDEVRTPEGWHPVFASSAIAGRSGVAIFSRAEPDSVRIGFGEPEFEEGGRYLEVDLPGLVVASLYLPSGDVGTPRQEEKERFMAAFLPYLVELRAKAEANGREVVVCGDWNIAHRGGSEELEGKPEELRLPADRTRACRRNASGWARSTARPGMWTWSVRCTRTSQGRTAGGPIGARVSTTTRAGGSTCRWPPGAWRDGPGRRWWSARPVMTSGGPITRR